jgi:hypothetical protein
MLRPNGGRRDSAVTETGGKEQQTQQLVADLTLYKVILQDTYWMAGGFERSLSWITLVGTVN